MRRPWERSRLPDSSSRTRCLALAVALGLPLTGACTTDRSSPPSTLAPGGPYASAIAQSSWVLFVLASLVFLLVVALLLYALFRSRRHGTEAVDELRPPTPAESTRLPGDRFVLAGGVALPVVVLVPLLVYLVLLSGQLRAPTTSPAFDVEVVGHQYWWTVRYPASGIESANEIHLPAGQPVRLVLTSTDVIHSFWVPQLMGKHDMTPGKTVTTWLQADQPGVYWGECAEFCGIQHAKMALLVVAEPTGEFQAWLERERSPALQAFAREGCIQCHAVRYGRGAIGGEIGPDLTHLASRQTLAAGILPNTRDNLATWVTNPQSIKPGNNMPPTNLDSDSLLALLAYLESLK
jgi:cytochrome c oxidase subunit 2